MFRKAAREGNLQYVKWFFQNAKDACAEDAGLFAAKEGHVDVVEWLSNSRETTLPSGARVTAVIRTAALGHPKGMGALLELQDGVDSQDPDGQTALHWAAKLGRALEVRELLERNAAVNAEDRSGLTALL